MKTIPELILLELRFKVLVPINNLPHYHGAQWSALFRNIIKPYFEPDMSDAGIWIHPLGLASAIALAFLTIPILQRSYKGLVEQRRLPENGHLTGLTDRYIRVDLAGEDDLMNTIVPVRVEDVGPDRAYGRSTA